MTNISRKRWQIEKRNKNEKCRELNEEQYYRKISPIISPGKEIIFYAKLIKINMKSISDRNLKVTTGISTPCLVKLVNINLKSDATKTTSLTVLLFFCSWHTAG